MAGIPLRAYNQDIERLIENGRADEAIAHCRYILETYPKYVDVYRLLGKGFLESQRYGDAADIFQRVLSSIPDDFVAQVGMSIIREDEGNLDEAIWHMERAFEVQPANAAIQDELRRLYGRRDGVEPPKIRLTRGALARMYAKGDLHQQATTEIRAAFAKNPNRLDLQVLLASIYARTGYQAEAIETANSVLRKLPNCLEAILIMIRMLSETDRSEDAEVFRQRLQQLDPYAAYITPEKPNLEDVADQAVKLEKLEWKPGETPIGRAGQPEWATSLGVDVEELAPTSEAEALPDWLSGVSPEQAEEAQAPQPSVPAFSPDSMEEAPSPSDQPFAEDEAAPTPKGEIPDWMQEAGWKQSTGELDESQVSLDLDESKTELEADDEELELAAAEIPDWLQAMAPPSEEEDQIEAEEDVSPWLDQILPPESQEAAPPWLQEEQPQEEDLAPSEVEPELQEPTEDEMPDWLKAGAAVTAVGAGAALAGESADSMQEEGEVSEGPGESELEPTEELPEWLLEIERGEVPGELDEKVPSTETAPAGTAEGITPFEELPDWLSEGEEAPSEPIPLEVPAEAEPAAELPEWLVGEESTTEPATPEIPIEPVTKAESEIELPDWLLEEETPAKPTPSEMPAEAEPVAEGGPFDELPEWLLEGEEAPTEVYPTEPAMEAEPAPEIPEWLLEEEVPAETIPAEPEQETPELLSEVEEPLILGDTQPTRVSEPEEAPAEAVPAESILAEPAVEAEPDLEIPEWLLEEEAPAPLPEQPSIAEAPPEEPVSEPAPEAPPEEIPSDIEDSEAAFAWLESLAVKQGAEEALLLTPEERLEEPPEWIQQAALEAGEEPAEHEIEERPQIAATETEPPEEVSPTPPEAEILAMEPVSELEPEVEAPAVEEPSVEVPFEEVSAAPPLAETPAAEEVSAPELEAEPSTVEAISEPEVVSEEVAEPAEAVFEPEPEVEALPSVEEEPAIEEVRPFIQEAELEVPVPEQVEPPPEVEPFEITPEETTLEEAILEEALPPEPVEKMVEEVSPMLEEPALEEAEEVIEAPPALEEPPAPEPPEVEAELPQPVPALEEVEVPKVAEAPPEVEQAEAPEPVAEVPDLPDWLSEGLPQTDELEWLPPPIHLDLNKASLAQLERLPGVGFIMAQQIVNYRETHGLFTRVEDLLQVPGFSQATLEGIQNNLFVEAPEKAAAPAEEQRLLLGDEGEAPTGLSEARTALGEGNLETALGKYGNLIQSSQFLSRVIDDLQEIAQRYPADVNVWQHLGDAHLRSDRVQEALQAYIKAEELLR